MPGEIVGKVPIVRTVRFVAKTSVQLANRAPSVEALKSATQASVSRATASSLRIVTTVRCVKTLPVRLAPPTRSVGQEIYVSTKSVARGTVVNPPTVRADWFARAIAAQHAPPTETAEAERSVPADDAESPSALKTPIAQGGRSVETKAVSTVRRTRTAVRKHAWQVDASIHSVRKANPAPAGRSVKTSNAPTALQIASASPVRNVEAGAALL